MKSKLSNTSKDGDVNDVEVLVPGENKSKQNSANTNASIKRTRNQNGEKFPSKKCRKDGNLSSTKPPQSPRHSTDENIRYNIKSSGIRTVTNPFQPGNSTRKKGQENDRKELRLAAASARDARQKACSDPFWEQMETLFAPITPEDLLLLKQPRPYEVYSGIQSQVSNDQREAPVVSPVSCDEHDALDAIPKDNASTERSLLEQGAVNPATISFKSSTVPSLIQISLAGLIDEDEIEHMEDIQSEDVPEVNIQSNDNIRIDDVSEAENTGSETDQNVSMLGPFSSNEQCQADAAARFMREYNICKVLDLPLPKKVKMPIITSLPGHEYQTLSLDDKLKLEFQSLGLNLEMLPQPKETEGLIEQEIKALEEKLRQQGSAIKEKFMKIEKAIEHEQDLDKRSAEVAPLEKLVEIASRKLAAKGKKGCLKNHCTPKNLAFIVRTLDRCKEFEETGRSCFSVLNPPCPTDKENVQLNRVNIASTDSTEAGKRRKARGSAPSTSVSGGTINKTKRKRGADNKPPITALQTPVPNTDRACSSRSSEPSSNQDLTSSKNIEKVNNDAIVVIEEEEEDESDQEMTRRIRLLSKRKKTSNVLASCSTTLSPTTKKHDEQPPISSSNTPTTEKQDEQQPISSSSKTGPVDNAGDKVKESEDVTGSSRVSIEVTDADIERLGEQDGLRSIFEFIDKEDNAMEFNGVGLDVPMDNLCDVDDALWNGWK